MPSVIVFYALFSVPQSILLCSKSHEAAIKEAMQQQLIVIGLTTQPLVSPGKHCGYGFEASGSLSIFRDSVFKQDLMNKGFEPKAPSLWT